MMNSGVYMNIQNVDRVEGWDGVPASRCVTNNELVFARDGLTASVLVARQPASDNLYLAVNGKTDASSRVDLETQILLGALPLLFHPDAARRLDHRARERHHRRLCGDPSRRAHPRRRGRGCDGRGRARASRRFNHDVLDDPRVTALDQRRAQRASVQPGDYDVIVSEPSNPWMTVAANLFTEDFFASARSRLRPGRCFRPVDPDLLPRSRRPEIDPGRVPSSVFPHVLVFRGLPTASTCWSSAPTGRSCSTSTRWSDASSELWVRADLARVGVRAPPDLGGDAADRRSGGSTTSCAGARSTRTTTDSSSSRPPRRSTSTPRMRT